MTYTVIIKKSAQKQIAAIPFPYIAAIEKAVLALADNPRPTGCKKLTGSKNIFRVRVSTYRIVYEVQDKMITVFVFDVDHRKQVYRS